LGCSRWTNVGVNVSRHLKLFGRGIISEVSNLCEKHTSTSQTGRRHTVA